MQPAQALLVFGAVQQPEVEQHPAGTAPTGMQLTGIQQIDRQPAAGEQQVSGTQQQQYTCCGLVTADSVDTAILLSRIVSG